MSKKGQVELADLAGFILIFIGVIIFGYLFLRLSPKSSIEMYDVGVGDSFLKHDLLKYLQYTSEGKNTADIIFLAMKNNDFSKLEEWNNKIFGGCYRLKLQSKGFEKIIENIPLTCDTDEEFFVQHLIVLTNFEKEPVYVQLYLPKSQGVKMFG